MIIRTISLSMFLLVVLLNDASGYLGKVVTLPNGHILSYGAPMGVLPEDIHPDNVKIAHIIPLLDEIEGILLQGRDLPPWTEGRQICGAFYLLSFVNDARFKQEIFKRYGKPWFDKYGEKEPDIVRLYYLTGGSLDTLRSLYERTMDDRIRRAIEACFFEAGVLLGKNEDFIPPVDDNNLLAVRIWSERSKCISSNEQPLNVELLYEEPIVVEREKKPVAEIDHSFDVYIEYKNTSEYPIMFKTPWHYIVPEYFSYKRRDNKPVKGELYKGEFARWHEITLYPADTLIKKTSFVINRSSNAYYSSSIFRGAFLNDCVCMDTIQGPRNMFLGANAGASFEFDVQVAQEFKVENGRVTQEKISYSNIIPFKYDPDGASRASKVYEVKLALWKKVRDYEKWKIKKWEKSSVSGR